MISRRQMLAHCLAVPAYAQLAASTFKIKQVRSWGDLLFGGFSPDGQKAFFNTAPGFGLPYSWTVVDVDSWKELYAFKRKDWAETSRFFGDNQRLYVTSNGYGEDILIDLQNRSHIALRKRNTGSPQDSYSPLSGQRLLGLRSDFTPARYALRIVELPDYRELLRVPCEGSLHLSLDGNVSICTDFANEMIVCRRTSDLALLWKTRGRPHGLVTSADGTLVAYYTHESSEQAVLLSGSDGSILAQLPAKGVACVALSPNGRLLAVATLSKAGADSDISIFELPSLTRLVTLSQDRGVTKPLNQGIGRIEFTRDNRYLITQGHEQRLWKIEGASA